MTEIEMLEAEREKHEEAIRRINMRIQEVKHTQMATVYPHEDWLPHIRTRKKTSRKRKTESN